MSYWQISIFFFCIILDSEIQKCTVNLGRDECVKCSTSYINPYHVSSVDKVEHRCFEKRNIHEQCPLGMYT